MKKSGVKSFLISCLLWLIPGVAAGVVFAVFLSLSEYQMGVRFAAAYNEGESLPSILKYTIGKVIEAEERGNLQSENTRSGENTRESGETTGENEIDARAGSNPTEYLQQYGYSRFARVDENLPISLAISLILFEGTGMLLFLLRRKREKEELERINELTEYLRAAGRSEAKALTRREDAYSYLEDEIYKTVIMLSATREEAVRDHEILASRIADIAHQLKTPLTSMSIMTELIEPSGDEDGQEYIDRLKQQVERLKRLVEGLLSLAKLDSHTIEFQREDTEVEELIYEAVQPLKEMMERKHISFRMLDAVDNMSDIHIKVDVQWTAEALLNLLKNCIEHTPENGEITVSCVQNPIYTQITVQDEGSGFSKKDLPHIFERFYKGEKADKDSVGIGLALAQLIIEKQNGQIHAENTADGHARFCIRFFI